MAWMSMLGVSVLAMLAWFVVEKRRRRTHPVPPGHQADIDLPHEHEFELYHNALSLCSMKTRVCLAELRIPYASRHIDLIETGRYENIRPKLLTVNPGGTVPVLLHHGHPVYESHEQIRYAARFAPEGVPSLLPSDPAELAEMEDWIDRSSLTDDPLNNMDRSAGNAIPGQTLPLFCTMIEKVPLSRIVEGLLFHFDKMRPVLFIVLKLRGIDRLPDWSLVSKSIARSRRFLNEHLAPLEESLEKRGGPWILGEQFTLADVSWLVIFERMRQADCESVFLDPAVHPHLAAYWARLQDRPSYAEAILGHTHPLIEYGRKRIIDAKSSNPKVRACLEGA